MPRSNLRHKILGLICLKKTFHYASLQILRSTFCKCSIYHHNLHFYCLNFFSFEHTAGIANPGLIGFILVSQVANTRRFDIDISPRQKEKTKYHKAVLRDKYNSSLKVDEKAWNSFVYDQKIFV